MTIEDIQKEAKNRFVESRSKQDAFIKGAEWILNQEPKKVMLAIVVDDHVLEWLNTMTYSRITGMLTNIRRANTTCIYYEL